MRLDPDHPLNRALIHRFGGRAGHAIQNPDQHPDPYRGAGSHPDVVEWLWDVLGGSLDADCRALVYGAPALVHPTAGVVLALAWGTRYALRVPVGRAGEAHAAGCATAVEWSGGDVTDLSTELDEGWVFGAWADAEAAWLGELYASL